MSEIPAAVSESTAIEIVRTEGSAHSEKSVTTLTAGDIVYFANNSGLVQVVAAINSYSIFGIALYDATSGNRVTTIRGKVRGRWDGTGTVNKGTSIGSSATRSGWFEPSAITSGVLNIGFSYNNLGATNSGTLTPIELY